MWSDEQPVEATLGKRRFSAINAMNRFEPTVPSEWRNSPFNWAVVRDSKGGRILVQRACPPGTPRPWWFVFLAVTDA